MKLRNQSCQLILGHYKLPIFYIYVNYFLEYLYLKGAEDFSI